MYYIKINLKEIPKKQKGHTNRVKSILRIFNINKKI